MRRPGVDLAVEPLAAVSELAWAAGFFEAQGRFTVYRTSRGGEERIRMYLTYAVREPLDRLAAVLGGEVVTLDYVPREEGRPLRYHLGKPHGTTAYRWQTSGDEARAAVMKMTPYWSQWRVTDWKSELARLL